MPSIINATTSTGLVSSADNSGSLQLATNNGTTAVTIDTSQNVGIGTSSPTGYGRTLQVAQTAGDDATFSLGTASAGSTSNVYLNARPGSSANFFLGTQNGSILFATGLNTGTNIGTERMRLTASGNLLIGITTPLPNNTGKITTFATAGSTAGWVSKGNANGYYGSLFENASNTTVGFIQVDASSTNYSTTSDYRLKENIAPMTGALATVAALKPCTYKWKIDGSDGQGFIAHELAEVCPQAVSGEKDAVDTFTDEDGNEQTRIKPQGIDTSFLVATLTAAIQELKAELDATKAEVQALKGVA